jgi:hypothetical protein
MSQMTHSVVILPQNCQGIMSTISRQTKEVSKQSRSQSYEGERNNEKTQERKLYRPINLII